MYERRSFFPLYCGGPSRTYPVVWSTQQLLTVSVLKIFLFHPVAESFGMNTWQVPFPSWQTMLPQLAFFFVFEDMFHYFCSCYSPVSFLFGQADLYLL
jgi:hypothetical protein